MKLEHGDLVHVRNPVTGSIDLAKYNCYDCFFSDGAEPHTAEHRMEFSYFGTDFTDYFDEVEVVEKLILVRAT